MRLPWRKVVMVHQTFRSTITALMVAFALAWVSPSRGQSPAVKIDRPLFKVGDTWEYRNYQVSSDTLNRTWVEIVLEVQPDRIRLRRTDSTGEPPEESKIKISEMYNYPLFVGKEWRQPIVENGKTIGESRNVVRSWEKISTGAGTFDTLRIEDSFTRPEGSFRTIVWYAPAARNLVRHYYLDKQGSPDQGTELIRLKLQ
jgi:hypothetical protein